MEHTTKSLAKTLQEFPEIPVYFTSEYKNYIEGVTNEDIRLVWLRKSTIEDMYPLYDEDLEEMIKEINEENEQDEIDEEVTEHDFIRVLLISRG